MNITVFECLGIIVAYVVVSFVAAYIIKWLLKGYSESLENDRGLKGAGMTIGIFERMLVLTFIIFNQYTAIGIIFAAKSIARFNELKDRKMAEYYLIGTLSSIFLAVAVGIVIRLILLENVF